MCSVLEPGFVFIFPTTPPIDDTDKTFSKHWHGRIVGVLAMNTQKNYICIFIFLPLMITQDEEGLAIK